MSLMAFLAVVIVAAIAGLTVMTWTYIRSSHRLEEQRDQRRHELALRETAAAEKRMEAEATEKDRLVYHTEQTKLAQQVMTYVESYRNNLTDKGEQDIVAAVRRQLDDEVPIEAALARPEFYSITDGKAKLA